MRPFKSDDEEDDVLSAVMDAPAVDDGAEEAAEGEMSVPGGDDEAAEGDETKTDPSRVLDEAMAKLEELRGLVASA